MPFYRGERITFDVAPSRLDFTVEHDSLRIEVRLHSALEAGVWVPSPGHISTLSRMAIGGSSTLDTLTLLHSFFILLS